MTLLCVEAGVWCIAKQRVVFRASLTFKLKHGTRILRTGSWASVISKSRVRKVGNENKVMDALRTGVLVGLLRIGSVMCL